VVLLDLDGTLADSRQGIIYSVQHTMDRLHLPHLDETALQRFLGPPVHDSFAGLGLPQASYELLSLPLNLDQNRHSPFRRQPTVARRRQRDRAKTLPALRR
jgi:phosphoglycolate phosphatase-like HAD superfamily hydrolase